MGKFIDLTGQRFGRLIVVERTGYKGANITWLCLCDCGKFTVVESRNLNNGHTESCGCSRIKHGHRKIRTKIYSVWISMNGRCNNLNDSDYKDYGGRGILVCDRWNKLKGGSFENFLQDMGQPPTNKHQIDRRNNDDGYCKENCHWVLCKENNRNRRNTLSFIYKDKIKSLSAWAEEYKIKWRVLYKRIYRCGWCIEKALLTPVKTHEKI